MTAPSGGRRTSDDLEIRPAEVTDAAAMASIYNHEVRNHTTTLDLVPRTVEAQEAWIAARSGAFSAVVAILTGHEGELGERDGATTGELVGFASLSPYKERAAYSPTVENSVYVSRDHAGTGIGRALMDHLIERARSSGFHSMIARVEASGEASLALHRACGFELIGVERQVGRKFGKWLDVASLQLML